MGSATRQTRPGYRRTPSDFFPAVSSRRSCLHATPARLLIRQLADVSPSRDVEANLHHNRDLGALGLSFGLADAPAALGQRELAPGQPIGQAGGLGVPQPADDPLQRVPPMRQRVPLPPSTSSHRGLTSTLGGRSTASGSGLRPGCG